MSLAHWDPVREVVGLRRAMDRWLNDDWSARSGGAWNEEAVPVDVVEREDAVLVTASVPGYSAEDIEVTVQGDVLTLRGTKQAEHEKTEGNYHLRERRSNSFMRSLGLPCAVASDGAKATYKNGELVLELPKRADSMSKRIAVTNADTTKSKEINA
jgi:HSP20 family protein